MASLGGILGGLQSRQNPGRNMAPGAYTYRATGPRGRSKLPTSVYHGLGGPRGSAAGVAALTALPTATNGGAIPTGPRPAPPTGLPGRTAPPPPPTLPAAQPLPNAPVASLQTFDQWLATNPQWTAQTTQSAAARNGLLAQYGWTRDAQGNLVKATNAAPDSVLGGLDLALGRNKQGAAQSASNHGSLFSGATQNEVDKATQSYETGVAHAQTSLLAGLGAVDQQDLDTKVGLGPQYQTDVGSAKVDDPASVIAHFAGLDPGHAVSGIDAYLKQYGKFLKPNELAEFARQRAIAWAKFTAPKPAPKPAPPKKAPPKKAPPKKASGGTKIRNGGIAGGAGR